MSQIFDIFERDAVPGSWRNLPMKEGEADDGFAYWVAHTAWYPQRKRHQHERSDHEQSPKRGVKKSFHFGTSIFEELTIGAIIAFDNLSVKTYNIGSS